MATTEDREKRCEDRIADQLREMEKTAAAVLAAHRDEKVCTHCGGELHEHSKVSGVWLHEFGGVLCDVMPGEAQTFAEPNDEYGEESIYDFGLSLETKITLKWLFSWGGPSDWLEITCGYDADDVRRHLEIESVTYHFSDWFDHAERPVHEGSALWKLAEWAVDLKNDTGL